MKIRHATVQDLKAIESLAEDKGEIYFRRIIKEGICFVAEVGIIRKEKGIVGVVYGEKNEAEEWTDLRGIMVHPEWREEGIGTKLIKRFLKEATGEVEVFYKGEARIINKLGFKKVGNYNLFTKEQ